MVFTKNGQGYKVGMHNTQCRVPIKAKGDFSQLFYSFSRDISCDPETLLFINTAHVTVTTDKNGQGYEVGMHNT